MDNSRKFFTYQFIVITAGTVVGLYIYNKLISKSPIQAQSLYQQPLYQQPLYQQPLYQQPYVRSMNNTIPEPPKYELNITTCELDETNSQWIPTLTHTFYGNSQEEIDSVINSHRQTDSFFNASFEGIFNWKGGTIQLKNITSSLLHTE